MLKKTEIEEGEREGEKSKGKGKVMEEERANITYNESKVKKKEVKKGPRKLNGEYNNHDNTDAKYTKSENKGNVK